LVAHIALAVVLTVVWGVLGAAAAVLVAAVLFEAVPVARLAGRDPASASNWKRVTTIQLRLALLGGAGLFVLAWCRIQLGGWSVAACVAAAMVLAAVSASQIVRYLRSARKLVVDA
jgi:hypothetical protein